MIGREVRAQLSALERPLPVAVLACVGGGSNAMESSRVRADEDVELVGVEAAGEGIESGRHSASLSVGRPGVLHGSLSYLLQDEAGQVAPAHSVSAGLDYPGVGPEHAHLKDSGRAQYVSVTDAEALEAFSGSLDWKELFQLWRVRTRLLIFCAQGTVGPAGVLW